MAFSKSFDRTAFVKDVQQGIGKAADGGFIPPCFPGYDNTDSEQKYDVPRQALLEKASPLEGCPHRTQVHLLIPGDNKARAEWAQVLNTNLA